MALGERGIRSLAAAGNYKPRRQFLLSERIPVEAHLQRMRELTSFKQRGGTLDVLLADHALYRLEADLRWIDHTAARLDQSARAVRS